MSAMSPAPKGFDRSIPVTLAPQASDDGSTRITYASAAFTAAGVIGMWRSRAPTAL